MLQFAQSIGGVSADMAEVTGLAAPRDLVSLELSGSNLQAVDKYIQRQFGGVTLNDLKYDERGGLVNRFKILTHP